MRLLTVLLVLLGGPAAAQTVPDTTAPWRYYPLDVGDVREYRAFGMAGPDTTRVRIARDTVIEGTAYVVEVAESLRAHGGGPRYTYPLRFDTASATVRMRWPDGEERVWASGGCRLDAPFGAILSCWGAAPVAVRGGADTTFVLGDGSTLAGVTLKEFRATEGNAGATYFVAGSGYVGYDLGYEPGGDRLSFARIRGVEYGTPVLAAEPADPMASALRLDVRPSPFRDRATVALEIDRPAQVTVEAFDVLGRRVAVLHDGPMPAGRRELALYARGFPPGLYLVRAETGGAVVTRRVARY